MAATNSRRTIVDEATSWPGVASGTQRFGGIEFRLGKREIGHLHGESLLDVPFPLSVKEELVGSGEAEEHHILPQSGWISFRIRSNDDIEHAILLLRRSFEIASESSLRRESNARITMLKERQL